MVRQSSADCFYSDSFQDQSRSERERVELYLRFKGPTTRREVAEALHMERGTVSRAVCELMDDKRPGVDPAVIELDEMRPCPVTGRRVTWICHVEHAGNMQLKMAV